jgi:hypothetical protein
LQPQPPETLNRKSRSQSASASQKKYAPNLSRAPLNRSPSADERPLSPEVAPKSSASISPEPYRPPFLRAKSESSFPNQIDSREVQKLSQKPLPSRPVLTREAPLNKTLPLKPFSPTSPKRVIPLEVEAISIPPEIQLAIPFHLKSIDVPIPVSLSDDVPPGFDRLPNEIVEPLSMSD